MTEGADEFIETERKYDAAADFALPDLAGLDGVAAVTGPRTYRLRAVYFDTPDFSLLKAKITLRRRTGGEDAGWHLKLPAGADSRREVHAPLGRSTRKVPWLAGQDGQVLAEIADDLVVGSLPAADQPTGPGRDGGQAEGGPKWREASRWREVEIELGTGSRALLASAGERLRRAGAAPSPAPSKLSRLLASAGLPGGR